MEQDNKPEIVKKAGMNDQHAADNAPMQDTVPPKSSVIKEMSEEEAKGGYLSFFLGSDKPTINSSEEALSLWLNAQAADSLVRDKEISVSEANARKELWSEFAKKNYPDSEEEEMDTYFRKLLNFHQQLFDDILVRSRAIREPNISNQHHRGDGLIVSDIIGKLPQDNRKLSISEIMRRSAVRGAKTDYNFDTLLRNSFMRLTVKRPDNLELGDLIRKIAEEVKGVVRQVSKNTPTIANIAAMRIIWKFIADNTASCSVKDTRDFAELASTIRITDFPVLCLDLVSSMYNKGVTTELNCLRPDCRHRSYESMDPKTMLHVRRNNQTAEEAAVYGNVLNGVRSYSREEIEKLVKKIDFGTDGPVRVYSPDNTYYFELAAPTLQQAFDSFDYFISEINPRVQQLQATIADVKVYERELNVLLSQIAATEFLHWVSRYVQLPTPNTDEVEMVIDRNNPEVDPYEFNSGLMKVLNDNTELSKSLIKAIYNRSPYLSKTFCAISDYECRGCGQRQSEIAKEQNLPTPYTPFNPVMHFFILAQLNMVQQASGLVDTTSEVLSN